MDTNGGFHTNTETNEGDKGGGDWGGGKKKIALRDKTFSFFVFLRLVPPIFLPHCAATFHTKLRGAAAILIVRQ